MDLTEQTTIIKNSICKYFIENENCTSINYNTLENLIKDQDYSEDLILVCLHELEDTNDIQLDITTDSKIPKSLKLNLLTLYNYLNNTVDFENIEKQIVKSLINDAPDTAKDIKNNLNNISLNIIIACLSYYNFLGYITLIPTTSGDLIKNITTKGNITFNNFLKN
jgi:hypothetical protein